MPTDAIAFLDVEASSLSHGFPLEVAWCSADLLHGASYLVRPAPGWLDRFAWTREAEALHGLTRERVAAEGLPADEVADRLAADLAGRLVRSDNPSFDGGWLRLLRDPPPVALDHATAPGGPALGAKSDLTPHRALDDAVLLAMAFASFGDGEAPLPPEEALTRGHALVARCGRR